MRRRLFLLGGALCATSFVLQQQGRFALSALLFGLYLVADNVDGKHARATGQTSEWGAVLCAPISAPHLILPFSASR